LWTANEDGYKLNPDVRIALLTIAQDFVEGLKEDYEIILPVTDVIIIGSITNYNWSPYSDIDLHIVTDFQTLNIPATEAQITLDAIKSAWNTKHEITMKGHDVELYVQDKNHLTHSASEYSALQDKWIKPPVKEKPQFNKELIKKKYAEYKKQLTVLLAKHDEEGLKTLLDKLYKYRQAGLDKAGDLSEENIVFKIFRAKGDLDTLKDYITKIYDKEVSITEDSLINDGLSMTSDKDLYYDYDENEGEFNLIPTDDDKAQRIRTRNFGPNKEPIKIFSAYRTRPKAVRATGKMNKLEKDPESKMVNRFMDVKKLVKHPGTAENKEIIQELIEVSMDRFFKQMPHADEINTIVPLGSTSYLNNEIAKEFKKHLPHASVVKDFIKKSKWKDVKLSKTYYEELKVKPNAPWLSDAREKLRNTIITEPDKIFAVKQVPMSHRLYYGNFYQLSNGKNFDSKRLFTNKTVLLIDDTLEKGSTLIEALRILDEFDAKYIVGYIFMYGIGPSEEDKK
jgi:hypothetical protein